MVSRRTSIIDLVLILLMLFGGIFRCARPTDPPDHSGDELLISIEKESSGDPALVWDSSSPAMAVIEYGTDSANVDYYLYSARDKYALSHRLTLFDGPSGSFYYRVRQVFSDGSTQITPFALFPDSLSRRSAACFQFTLFNLSTESGDCIFIETPSGKKVMIDAGTRTAAQGVTGLLAEMGVDTLDYFLGTHDHADHLGGFSTIAAAVVIRNLILPDHFERDDYFSRAQSTVRQHGGQTWTVSRGNTDENSPFLAWDPALHIEVWASGCGDDFPNISYDGSRINNDSPLLKLSFGNFQLVTGGDSENEVHKRYVTDDPDIDAGADVFKASHHGRTDSNDRLFLDAVDPTAVLISTFDDGSCNGLFQCATLPIFHAVNAEVFRTDCASPELNHSNPNKKKNADIRCISDGSCFIIETR